MSHPHGFYGNHRLQARPFRQCWQGRPVCHRPDASTHAASMGVVERIKEIVRIAPRHIVLDMAMKVLGNSLVGLFMIVLSCQEIVAALLQNLGGDLGLAAHGIDRHNTALNGEQV